MDAKDPLLKVAKAFKQCRLEAILIGNAAAALQGAPVTTVDFDFMYRKTPLNSEKLKDVAKLLGGTISEPFALSSMKRLVAPGGIFVDFLSVVDGVKSFASLKSRSSKVKFEEYSINLSSLEDIIKSKEICARNKDLAVIELLKQTLSEKMLKKSSKDLTEKIKKLEETKEITKSKNSRGVKP